MSDKEVTIKVVQFSSSDKWQNWKELFLARVNKRNPELGNLFDLNKSFELEKEENGTQVPDEKNVKLMNEAYNELLLSMNYNAREGENAFNIVRWSKTKEGKGDAREAWRKLIDRYEPKTYLEKSKLIKEFYSSSCGNGEDPVQFIYLQENVRAKIHSIVNGKEIISDKDFMHQILISLPNAYDSLV